ncbi:hypothetical protein MMC28_006586 [Mycoblastus sanguinarius]|nr:hypothetical protein [Mycoblastus sanguinarius]
MHARLFLSAPILVLITAYAASINQIVASNNALVGIADKADADVVAMTASSTSTEAEQIPTDLQTLTNSISECLANDTSTPTTATSDPTTEDTVTSSYRLLVNTVVEMTYDLIYKQTVMQTFLQGRAIHKQMVNLNAEWVDYSNFMIGVVGDAQHQGEIHNATVYALSGIANATVAYSYNRTGWSFKG